MAYQVSRTDTGQFVLMDPATDTVVINDDIAQGFDAIERAVADKPRVSVAPTATATAAANSGDAAIQGSTTFAFRGGPRYSPILLAVVLPFAWLAVLYFALANLLSETALDRGADAETQERLEQLEREVQSLRSQTAGAPRTEKTKAARPKPKREPEPDDEDAPGEAAVAPVTAPATAPTSTPAGKTSKPGAAKLPD